MIARLSGRLVERAGGRAVVDCNGVGYAVGVSGYTMERLPALGEAVTLRVHTHFTQDRFSLYGFSSREEQEMFEALISVDGLGPAIALLILSGAPPTSVAAMIAGEDWKGMTTIKGIGRKKAEKVVFLLKEKCQLMLATWAAEGRAEMPAASAQTALLEELSLALVGLGYRRQTVEKALADLPVPDDATIESLLREALQIMPR